MTLYLEEFLWRGRAPDDARPPAWHVILASKGTDAFGQPYCDLSPALTPEQAKGLGFDLAAVFSVINSEALQECDRLRSELASAQGRVAELEAMHDPPGDG